MKKLLLTTLAIVFLIGSNLYANSSSDLFNYNEQKVENEFEQLNKMEQSLISNKKSGISPMLFNLQNSEGSSSSGNGGFSVNDMDWGAFAWGFCCCPVGFFTVAVNGDKSKDQKLSYWIGVGAGTILGAISNGIYYVSYGSLYTY